MNLPESSNTELKSSFNQLEFVESTVTQINKDLQGLFYGDFFLDKETTSNLLEELILKLTPILTELSKRLPEQLSQFIYRVDLSEKKFMDSISKDTSLNHLAYLIIEREAQKVYLRKRFS